MIIFNVKGTKIILNHFFFPPYFYVYGLVSAQALENPASVSVSCQFWCLLLIVFGNWFSKLDLNLILWVLSLCDS